MQSIGKMIPKLRREWWTVLVLVLIAGCSPINEPAPEITSSPIANTPTLVQPTGLNPTSAPTATPTEGLRAPTPAEIGTSPAPTVTQELAPVNVLSFPDPRAFSWQPVSDGMSRPVGLTHAGDGSERLFVVEQDGFIRLFLDGNLLPEPFLDISDRTEIRSSEQGLLGLAFDPRYFENGKFYMNYTDNNGDTVIARYRVSTGDPNRGDPASEEPLLFIPQPYGNHNGGGMAFGSDGYLYLGLGDGGAANDPNGYGQSTNTYLGKLLRIDVNTDQGYVIPADNPYINSGGLPEIWAYGLRNPWRFTFDRLTGDLYLGDVGQNTWEEINYLPAGSPGGANFGWDFREGMHPFEGQVPDGLELVEPVAEYDHSQGCSVTGGVVYRGRALPEWQGVYLYGDYCTGLVWGLLPGAEGGWQSSLLFDTDANVSAFGEDEKGEVYLVDYSGGVYRLTQR